MFARVGLLLRLVHNEVLKDGNNRFHFLVMVYRDRRTGIIAYIKKLHLCYPRNQKINT